MALSTVSYFYFMVGFISIIILGIFVGLLTRNFFKKRTVGTFLLIGAYLCVLINELLVMASFLLESILLTDTTIKISKVLQLIGVFSLVYNINWIYFFSNRHLLRDNDLFKLFYTSIFGGFVGMTAVLTFQDAITSSVSNLDPNWHEILQLGGTNFSLYYPPIEMPYGLITIGLMVIGTTTFIRLIFRAFQLQRKAKDIVTKKGLRVAGTSVFFLLGTGIILGVYFISIFRETSSLAFLVFFIRGIFVSSSVIFGYVGWIMPDWVRKRFRGQAWISKVYTGKISVPAIYEKLPVGAESLKTTTIEEIGKKDSEAIKIYELSEK